MSQRIPSHCAAMSASVCRGRRAQGGRERVELHHIGPRREVRVAAVGQDVPAGPHPARRVGLDVVLVAVHEQLRLARHPGVVGGDVVGHVVQEQPDAAGGQRGARRGQRLGAAERGVGDVPAHAVRRSDHVVGPQVGQRVPERGLQPGVRVRQRQAGRASLPHAHQPHRVDAGRRDRVPGRGGHVGQRHPPPGGPRQLVQPDRGVDLVDHRLVRPPGHVSIVASLTLLVAHVVAIRSLPPRVPGAPRFTDARQAASVPRPTAARITLAA